MTSFIGSDSFLETSLLFFVDLLDGGVDFAAAVVVLFGVVLPGCLLAEVLMVLGLEVVFLAEELAFDLGLEARKIPVLLPKSWL